MVKPLGLSHTTFETDSTGAFVGSSYIYASARDWAKLGYLLVEDGAFNEKQILPKDFVMAMQQPNSSSNDPSYGFQVWLNAGNEELRWPQLPKDAYAMRGNRGQIVLIIPSMEFVAVRLGWSQFWYPTEENFTPLIEALTRH